MKRLIAILVCAFGAHVYAVDYIPFVQSSSVPTATMQSVNSSSFMTSGSAYSSDVYEIGSSGPMATPAIRKSAPGTDDTGYDPSNPQFSPLGNAAIPLLIMAIIYMIVAYRRKTKVSDLCI